MVVCISKMAYLKAPPYYSMLNALTDSLYSSPVKDFFVVLQPLSLFLSPYFSINCPLLNLDTYQRFMRYNFTMRVFASLL